MGIFDDIKPIRAIYKLLIQVLAASVAVGFGIRIGNIANPFVQEAYINFRNYYNSKEKGSRNPLDLYLLICYGFEHQPHSDKTFDDRGHGCSSCGRAVL